MINLVDSINGLSAQWGEAMWAAVWQSTILAAGILILTLFLKGTMVEKSGVERRICSAR